MTALVLRRAAIAPGSEVDLTIVGDRLAEVTSTDRAGRSDGPTSGTGRGTEVVDLEGRAVVPGLVDHHIHLLGLAASWSSADCSPSALAAGGGLDTVLRAARRRVPSGWIRGVGYDPEESGPIDADRLAAIGVGPVRVQDRTGIQWVLDRAGLAEVLPPDPTTWPSGVDTDATGHPTGILTRLDAWLRTRLPPTPPDLGPVGRWLAGKGVTAVTDAGAGNGADELALLAAADLPQRVTAMTAAADLPPGPGPSGEEAVTVGPVKILLDDADLPPLDVLAARVAEAHRHGRTVAVHCVTPVQLVLALAAGVGHRDRIEHASLVPDDVLPVLARADPTVVVQPGLVATRGDRYLAHVDPADQPGLHRLGSLRAAGLRVAAGTDAPYGPADPWEAIAAAVHRRTAAGRPLGSDEAVTPEEALTLFTGPPAEPGRPRSLRPGQPADLAVLDGDWATLATGPGVAATLVAGRLVHGALPG